MGKWIHILNNIDKEKLTAICSKCGNVSVVIKGGKYKCIVSVKEQKRKWRGEVRHGFRTGICPICLTFTENLVHDHDHTTLEFRGWICPNCNLALGLFKDNLQSIKNSIKYLKQKRPPN